jgi:hypothetical protein
MTQLQQILLTSTVTIAGVVIVLGVTQFNEIADVLGLCTRSK